MRLRDVIEERASRKFFEEQAQADRPVERIEDAAKAKLSALLTTGVREISYVYDMGDNWQHRIIVEKLNTAEPGALYPQFLGGERRCPPENCGALPAITNSWTI